MMLRNLHSISFSPMSSRIPRNIVFYCHAIGAMDQDTSLVGVSDDIFRHNGPITVVTKVEMDRVATWSDETTVRFSILSNKKIKQRM